MNLTDLRRLIQEEVQSLMEGDYTLVDDGWAIHHFKAADNSAAEKIAKQYCIKNKIGPQKARLRAHNCWDYPQYTETDGPIGHGYECGKCGSILQVG